MAAPQKIGVLTFHRCINYGSYWQARSLVEGLRARGHDAVLLDHHSDRVTWAEYRCALQPSLPDPTPRSDFRHYAAKARHFLDAFPLLPTTRRFGLDSPHETEHFDTVVVGSDEVWNLRHPWYGGQPIFYGAGLNADRVVSYAASFGNHDAGDGLDERYAERLRSFDRISVRDENSRALVREATGEETTLVLDPVLQFPDSARGSVAPAPSEDPYLLVYGHNFPGWYADAMRAAARAHGLRLVSVGYRNDWAGEQRISAGPIDFARLVAGSSAVATNFFHGCVFALLNGKPFAAVSMPYRHHKLRDLTAALGARHHLVAEDCGNVADLLAAPLDPAIGRNIRELRAASNGYLDLALAA